ncbi:MAG: hypothetical protein ABSA02_12760 [Trebonia sp.]
MSAVLGWNEKTESWLNRLRTWQFVLVWAGAAAVFAALGAILFEWVLTRSLNPSALLGTVVGVVIASTIFAFPTRAKMQDKAERGA